VDRADPGGVADVLVTPDGEWIVTNNIEAGRMREEETPAMEVAEHPWYEPPDSLIRELAGGARLGSDIPVGGEDDISDELARMRLVLDPDAIQRYRSVGSDAAAALSEAVEIVSPDTSELDAAAELEAALRRRSMNAAVLLVGGEARAARYRHPVPGAEVDARLGGRATFVACAERGGLYANSTRIVNLREPDSGVRRMQSACDNILARATESTKVGRDLSQVFAEIADAYREEGFPEAWRHHHQGGVTGYASREVIATPHTEVEVRADMAFAFNPSLSEAGAFAKAEETFLLTSNGPEILTEEGGA
jgi:Xaa-Pro aminopeptidase